MRICQNDNCTHELKPNQKKYCSRACYQEARTQKKLDEAVSRVYKFRKLNPEIVDVLNVPKKFITQHFSSYVGILGVSYKLIVCIDSSPDRDRDVLSGDNTKKV